MLRRKRNNFIWIAVLLVLVLLVGFFMALGNLRRSNSREARLQLEDALRRAAVACYAAEGIYPPTVEYLQEHYGVQVDETRYAVFYEIFADNLMPEITVLEK